MTIQNWIDQINHWVWGPPLLILLLIVGLYLTIKTRGIQFRYLWYAHKLAFTRQDDEAEGDISQFQALMTALAGTIGIGSITGVATAIALGGLGSLFWMWVAALVGMATKYAEAILAIKYRVVDEGGEMCGGPMYYLEKGVKMKWLAVLFALFGAGAAIGTGNMVQANSVSQAAFALFGIHPAVTGIILLMAVAIALLGGIKSIGRVASFIVPVMAVFFLGIGFIIIISKISLVPSAFGAIIRAAFHGQAAIGGFAGAGIMLAIQLGVSRGIFSSEAGLGTSPIAAAAAKTDTPGRQALISMCSVFITTGIVCTITGLVIAMSGVQGGVDAQGVVLDGSPLALAAFDALFPHGGLFVTIALIPFAYSTMLSWAYYGEKCVEYLSGLKMVKLYRLLYIIVIVPGAMLSLEFVWGVANALNGLMAFPNLIGLFLLAGIVGKETEAFRRLLKAEQL